LLDRFESSHSGTHQHADAVGIGLGDRQSRIAHGLHAGDDPVLHEGIHAARILRAHVGLEIQLADLAAEMRRKAGGIETLDHIDAAAAGQDRGPGGRHVVAHRRDDS